MILCLKHWGIFASSFVEEQLKDKAVTEAPFFLKLVGVQFHVTGYKPRIQEHAIEVITKVLEGLS